MKRMVTIWIACLAMVTASGQVAPAALVRHLKEVYPGAGAPVAAPEARVFLFLSTECPLCRNYTRTLNALYSEFAGRVDFYGVIPGRTDSATAIVSWGQHYKILFPLYRDAYLLVSHRLKAEVTPQAIVLDRRGNVVYSGLIDDWVVDLGVQRAHISHHYLEDALTALGKGGMPPLDKTQPVGCLINAF